MMESTDDQPRRLAAELRLAADRHKLYSSDPDALDDLLRRAADELAKHAAPVIVTERRKARQGEWFIDIDGERYMVMNVDDNDPERDVIVNAERWFPLTLTPPPRGSFVTDCDETQTLTAMDVTRAALLEAGRPDLAARLGRGAIPSMSGLYIDVRFPDTRLVVKAFVIGHRSVGHDVDDYDYGLHCNTCWGQP